MPQKIKKRYLHDYIARDLKRKMVFIGGPRQVGKTTLANQIGKNLGISTCYLNWDTPEHHQMIIDQEFPQDTRLLIFDEIHKYGSWKNYLKGLFDSHHEQYKILVTGSARLDVYRRGGDSMLGRYHYYRLHPFSVAEIVGQKPPKEIPAELSFRDQPGAAAALAKLARQGGFPEPLFYPGIVTLQRWQNERAERLIKEDVRDLEIIRDLSALQVLTSLLPEKAGGRLSLNSLREDLSVAHKTIAHWMDVLERFYFHFRIYPYANTTIKSLRKEPKLYLWDWSAVPSAGERLENIVASHLLKFAHFWYDTAGYRVDLKYLRDIDGHEVDFLVTLNSKPWFAVEVKSGDRAISPHLRYFGKRLQIPYLYQVVDESDVYSWVKGVSLISADRFLAGLV